jgi:hypothetical protein
VVLEERGNLAAQSFGRRGMSELTAQHVLAVLFDSEDFPVAIPDRMRRPRSSFNGWSTPAL